MNYNNNNKMNEIKSMFQVSKFRNALFIIRWLMLLLFLMTTESNLCWPYTHGYGAIHCGQPPRGYPLRENWLPFPETISCQYVLSQVWGSTSPSASTLECLILCRSWADNHSTRGFLSYPEDTALWSPPTSGSDSVSEPSSRIVPECFFFGGGAGCSYWCPVCS